MGDVLEPRAWCRQRWCRSDASAQHFSGDGCSCQLHEHEGEPGTPGDEIGPAAPGSAGESKLVILTAKAARLAAFACRACGEQTRRMVEYPALFFRCEPCAAADRWPELRPGGRHI
jgi:hypothetical protein